MNNQYASTDFTYCVNKDCKNKCWRYEGNYLQKLQQTKNEKKKKDKRN